MKIDIFNAEEKYDILYTDPPWQQGRGGKKAARPNSTGTTVPYIFPSMLTQALTKAGYSSRKTLKYLADKGLIGVSVLKDGSTKNSVTKWFNNRNCRFVEFHLGDLAEEKDPLLEEEEIAEQMKPQQMSLPGTNDGWQTIPDEEADKLPFN